MAEKYYFLCEFFNKQIFIYAIKSSSSSWHYFEEEDSTMKVHVSLPADFRNQIVPLNELQEVPIDLVSHQIENYITDGKFVFKGKEMKTYIELAGIQTDQLGPNRKKKSNSTYDLVFVEGKTNPTVFLSQFEKCDDVKMDKDKVFKIRNFVNPDHRPVFSKLFFTSDWPTARSTFLKKYSLAYTTSKKTALDFKFVEETSLRSFVLRKMKAFSTYTRLSVEDQLEIILNELPIEVSNLFIIHDKMNCTKTEILEFCDTIQENMDEKDDEPDKDVTLTAHKIEQNQVAQDLELFNFDSNVTVTENDSSEVETSDLDKSTDEGKNLIRKSAKRSRSGILRGRPLKIKKIVCERSERNDNDNDDYQSTTSSGSNFGQF